MTKKLTDTIEWYGVIAILIAYTLVTLQVISANTLIYQILNLTGALGIIIGAYKKKDYQPVVLNIVWSIVAILGIALPLIHN